VSRLSTRHFFYGLDVGIDDIPIRLEQGVDLLVGLEAIGEPDERGMRRLVFRLNGQLRPLDIRDESCEVGSRSTEKADPANHGHVAAPFTGVVSMKVEVGDTVAANQPVAVIEAMKMESAISAPIAGTIERIPVAEVGSVEPGDLLAVIKPGPGG
jgi:pyruvate carboxylase